LGSGEIIGSGKKVILGLWKHKEIIYSHFKLVYSALVLKLTALVVSKISKFILQRIPL